MICSQYKSLVKITLSIELSMLQGTLNSVYATRKVEVVPTTHATADQLVGNTFIESQCV